MKAFVGYDLKAQFLKNKMLAINLGGINHKYVNLHKTTYECDLSFQLPTTKH